MMSDNTDYSLQVIDSIEEIEDLYGDGKLSRARVNSMLILVLCHRPRTLEELSRRRKSLGGWMHWSIR